MASSPALFNHSHDRHVLATGRRVLEIEAAALARLADALDDRFAQATRLIGGCAGRAVLTGIGKSGHVARKIAATLSATGSPALFVHAAEAAHGDLGSLIAGDVLVVLSNSGATPELRAIMRHAHALGCAIIGITGRADGMVADMADVALILPPLREACPANVAPTTSSTMMLALGDALALAVMEVRGVAHDSIHALHPGGAIGAGMIPVDELMHGPNGKGAARMPLVPMAMPMRDVLVEMTACSLGIAGVIDDAGALIGAITDGDLRRHVDRLLQSCAAEVMTGSPRTIASGSPARAARAMLSEQRITALFVVARDDPARPLGVIHIHDLARIACP